MKVSRIGYQDEYSGCTSLIKWLWLKEEPNTSLGYARYWHGYLVVLKPLLLLLDYADIRILNMIVQLLLLVWLIVSMIEIDRKKYVLPFIAAVAVANPVATLGMVAVFLLMKDDSDFSWKKCINLIKWCIVGELDILVCG